MLSDMAKNKPGIRFQGFNDEWKEATLSSLFNFNIPHNSLSRDKLNDEKGEVKDVHYGDVLIKYGAIVDAQKDQIPYITDSHASEYTAALLKDGDVVFADTAEDATAGKAVELQNVESNYVVAGLHTIVARPNETFSPYYLGYCFNSDKYHSKLVPLLQGIKVFSINKPALADTTFTFPLNKDEQKKIGEFFMQLDELINAKEQELEKLRQLKLALLDGMFPGDNQDNSNGGVNR
jgi:type I restriction enzyme S subunit